MRTFFDGKQHWAVEVNVATLRRVKGLVVDPFANLDSFWQRLIADPVFSGEVLWAVCKPQAEREGIDQETFLAALAGDILAAARQAFLEEMGDFFPDPPIRNAVRELLNRYQQLLADMITAPSLGGESSTSAPE